MVLLIFGEIGHEELLPVYLLTLVLEIDDALVHLMCVFDLRILRKKKKNIEKHFLCFPRTNG